MVELEHAGFAYGATEVFQDVSLSVEPGAFCVVYGRAGAGKTTLLRLCRGDLPPTQGAVRVLGRPVPARSRAAAAELRRRVGLVEQHNRFLGHLSLEENVAAPLLAEPGATRKGEDIAALLAWVGLAERTAERPCALRPDESRRAALARAVILGPDLVLADDPTNGLPDDEAIELATFFLDLNAMGTTILFATSDGDLAEHMLSARPVQLARLAAGRLETVA